MSARAVLMPAVSLTAPAFVQAAQANQAAQQQIQAGESAFANARAACLQGRGYSIK